MWMTDRPSPPTTTMNSPAPPHPAGGLAAKAMRAWRLHATAVVILTLDLATKQWVLNTIPEGTYNPPWKTIIDGTFYLVHIGNKGAAFGAFAGYGWLLAILAIVAIAAIYLFRKDLELHRPSLQIVFGLIIGGILGNFIDRVWHGHVIDFLDVHFPFDVPFIGPRFPAFNIADSGITTGVFLYFILAFFVLPKSDSDAKKIKKIPPESPGNSSQ